jgi:hypothetical protein
MEKNQFPKGCIEIERSELAQERFPCGMWMIPLLSSSCSKLNKAERRFGSASIAAG